MNRHLIIPLLLCACAFNAQAQNARQWLSKGETLYRQTNYNAAAEAFSQAAHQAPTNRLDPAVAYFDEANSLYQQGLFQDAAARYQEALKTSDLSLQEQVFFNRGNALMGVAGSLEQQQKADEAIKSVDEAMAMYENAMALAPTDADPKVNYELALKKKEELKQQQQQQQNQQQQDQDKKDQDQQKQDQQKQDSSPDQQQKDQQQQQDQPQNQQQQNQDQQKPEPQKPDEQKDPQEQPAQPPPEKFEEMTPEEARMLLESMKQDEQVKRDQMRRVIGQPVPVEKDW